MIKYLKVRGTDALVSNPHAPAQLRRYVGMRERAAVDTDLQSNKPRPILSLIDRFEPCVEIIESHADLLKAIGAGTLELIGEAKANTHEAARAKLAQGDD